jgi:hypothetical protein
MSVTNDLEDWLEWFSGNTARVDISSGAAAGAGLCVTGLVFLKISMLDRVDPLDFNGMMIALLGALLLVVSAGAFRFYTKALASNATPTTLGTIGDFIRDKAKDGLGVFVILSLLTLPITAVVHHAWNIVRGVRRWYYYGAEPPSILHDHERT